jgi:hypothetical protein
MRVKVDMKTGIVPARVRYWRLILKSVLIALVIVGAGGFGGVYAAQVKHRPEAAARADAATLCSFITQRMQPALPEVPTFCSAVTPDAGEYLYALPGNLVVNVFSPTNVLEGRMRRAWSTALFQAAQALFFDGALNGTCEFDLSGASAPGCELRVSDDSLSQSYLYYAVSVPLPLNYLLSGDPASEQFYQHWWQYLEEVKTSRRREAASKGDDQGTEFIAQDACNQYRAAFPNPRARGLPAPGCSVMLATSSRIDVVLDFPNSFDATFLNYTFPLLGTFGAAFDDTAYDGQVIFRSPWSDAGERLYRMYPLHDIEFAWEEAHSGARSEIASDALLTVLFLQDGITGVEGRHALSGKKRALRMPDVVRVTPVPSSGFDLVDLTDGSEWSVPTNGGEECDLTIGTRVTEIAAPAGRGRLRLDGCESGPHATFVQGW